MNVIDRLCRGVRPAFSDYLDHEPLPMHLRVRIELHLTLCPMCRRTMRSLQQTRASLHALRDVEPTVTPEE